MSKISMFGVSASGKTCFLYAMTQVLRNGVKTGESLVQLISSRAQQQTALNDGYTKLIKGQWPQTSDRTETYEFKVSMQCNNNFSEIIPMLEIQDYRGGLLQSTSELDTLELEELLDSFRGSSAIIFIIDGQTLIEALDVEERDTKHQNDTDFLKQFTSRSQIEFVENIFMEYKRVEDEIPPIMIAISKGDLFTSDREKENGIRFIKEKLPSLFSVGCKMTVGITTMSLGENLGSDNQGRLTGTLSLTTDFNIHVPVIYGIYADLCYQYEEIKDPDERAGITALLTSLRPLFANRIQLYENGQRALEI